MTIAERVKWKDVQRAWDSRPARGTRPEDADFGLIIMGVAEILDAYMNQTGTAQQTVAGWLDCTPGQIHHYVSLVRCLPADLQLAVRQDRLRFKVARAITGLPTQDRMRDIAALFMAGAISSVYAERAKKLALDHPHWTAEMVAAIATDPGLIGKAQITSPPPPPPPPPTPPEPARRVRNQRDLAVEIVWTAGAVKLGVVRRFSVGERLRIRAGLRVLREAVEELESAVSV